MGEELSEVNARLADLQAKVAELEKNSQGSTPSKSLLAAQAVSQLIILGFCLWAAIVSTINYAEAPSMKTSSMTPQLSTLKNAADDCPVAVHETKLVLQGGALLLQEDDVVDSEGRRRMTDSGYSAIGSPTCRMALTIADNYENGVDHVVIPCQTCGGVKMYPSLSPMMVAEQDDHFSLRGHIGAPLNALYEVHPLASPRAPPLALPAHHYSVAPPPPPDQVLLLTARVRGAAQSALRSGPGADRRGPEPSLPRARPRVGPRAGPRAVGRAHAV